MSPTIKENADRSYTLYTTLKGLNSGCYGGEFDGWDYLGHGLMVDYRQNVSFRQDEEMPLNEREWGSGLKYSDIIKQGVDIWNNANIEGSPEDGIFKVIDWESASGVIFGTTNSSETEAIAYSTYLNQYQNEININISKMAYEIWQSKYNEKPQYIMAHELGHALGLRDLYVDYEYANINNTNKIMYGYPEHTLDDNPKVLHEKEIEGIRKIQGWMVPENYAINNYEDHIRYASASYESVNDMDLYGDSNLIVVGTVESVGDYTENQSGNFPLSKVNIKIQEFIKNEDGIQDENLVVLQDGNSSIEFDKNQLLEIGEECILFLRKTPKGNYIFIGGAQGRFDVLKKNEKNCY